jgi:predicted AAA+ superfamily ATPase
MEIKRDDYLNQLIERQGNGLIKVVTGIRRCGKSYLLFTQFKQYLLNSGVEQSHIFEMAFDQFLNEDYREPHKFYEYLDQRIIDDGKPFYILLDEIQMLDRFEEVLNSFMNRSHVDIYVTGSNAHLLSQDVITEFRGRGDEIHLYPLSFSEFMTAYSGSQQDGFRDYMTYGGLPPVVLANDAESKTRLLNSLLNETYLRDIGQRHRIHHKPEMNELLDLLSSSIGSLTNPTKLSNTFRSVKKVNISQITIKTYIEYFEDAFLIEKAQRFDIKGRRYIDTPYKYYFTDLGLRNVRLNFRQLEETHMMENVLYNELRIRGYSVDVGVVEYNTVNSEKQNVRHQLEVDFVCNKGSKRYYIQSAYALPDETKLKQEETPLKRIDDSFKKIIIVNTMATAPHYTDDGILIMSMFDFLMNPTSMDVL